MALPPSESPAPLVRVEHLTVTYRVSAHDWGWRQQTLHAIDDLSLDIERGETVGIVGESGCGKTTLGRTLLGIVRPSSGRVLFDGVDVSRLAGPDLRRFRRRVQMVFQDPYSSLNPRMKVEDSVREPLRAQGVGSSREQKDRVAELLQLVGLPPDTANRFPNAFSGGQRQRIGIARALAIKPELVVADEPVSALDVSIQAQIVNLLLDLRDQLGLTLVFIAHDLAVVRQIATKVTVMYMGKIVEIGPTDGVFESPRHPYTRALLTALPVPDPDVERGRPLAVLQGEVPSPLTPPSGCRFHTRCPIARPVCSRVEPALLPAGPSVVACHAVNPLDGIGWGPPTSGAAAERSSDPASAGTDLRGNGQ